MIIDEISAIIGEKPKNIIIHLTEAIKIYTGFLLARSLYHQELFQFRSALKDLQFA